MNRPNGLGIDLPLAGRQPSYSASGSMSDFSSCVPNCGSPAIKSLPKTPALVPEPFLENTEAMHDSRHALAFYPLRSTLNESLNLDEWTIWTTLELNTILGDANSRLKAAAKLHSLASGPDVMYFLEKAKRRPRVDVDIFLKNDICIQGGFLEGFIKIHVKKCPKDSQSVLISGGKVRVIGFETVPKDNERFVFYQCSNELSEVADGLEALYCTEPDGEGYMQAREGIHCLPFSLHLSPSLERGTPKGRCSLLGGPSVRYVAMVSLRIKRSISEKKSVAHFYRTCCIWPRLNPSAVLAPTSRPLQLTVSEDSLTFGKIFFTASLHRLFWVAGQSCHVKLHIANKSKKPVKNLSLGLLQKITTFRGDMSDSDNEHTDHKPISSSKQITQSTLSVAETGTKCHASANGWWMGVGAGESQTFIESMLIPEDALSIPKGNLLEVSYTLQATLYTGTFLSSDLRVCLPIEIISSLSIDPPPNCIEKPTSVLQRQEHRIDSGIVEESIQYQSPYSSESGEFDDDYNSDDSDPYDSKSRRSDDDNTGLSQMETQSPVPTIANQNVEVDSGPLRFSDLYYSSIPQKVPENEEKIDNVIFSPRPLGTCTCGNKIQQKTYNFAGRVEDKMSKLKRVVAADHEAVINELMDQNTKLPPKGTEHTTSKPSVPIPEVSQYGCICQKHGTHDHSDVQEHPQLLSPGDQGIVQKRIAAITNLDRMVISTKDFSHSEENVTATTLGKIQGTYSEQGATNQHVAPETPVRSLSLGLMPPSSSAQSKSVKDKIRELEELAKTSDMTSRLKSST